MRWRPQLRPRDVAPAQRPQRHSTAGRAAPCDVDSALAALATAQGGNVKRSQLIVLGLSDSAVTRRIERGSLIPRFRGVYAVAHLATGTSGLLHAALLATGDDAALSQRTAAGVRGYLPLRVDRLHVLIHGRRLRSRGILVVHSSVEPFSVTSVDGLRVTDPLRTLQDLAAVATRDELATACSNALVRGHVSQAALDAARILGPAEVAPSRGRFERKFHTLLRHAGLPLPLANFSIGPYVPDYVWPAERVIVETDGYSTHGHRAAFEADRDRDAALAATGWIVIRVTWKQLLEQPAKVTTRLAQVLAIRGQDVAGLPQPR